MLIKNNDLINVTLFILVTKYARTFYIYVLIKSIFKTEYPFALLADSQFQNLYIYKHMLDVLTRNKIMYVRPKLTKLCI